MISYSRSGSGTPVICLHGWPGDSSDYRALVPLLSDSADVIVPDLLGFGASFTPGDVDRPPSDFGRDAQVAAVVSLMDSLSLEPAVVVGYDMGMSMGTALAREHPERVRGLVLGNVVPPALAPRVLDDEHRAEFWYQDFHQLALAPALVDGSVTAVRAYLDHFWSHWGHRPAAVATDTLVDYYARPGAFTVSLNWYRSGSGTLATALANRSLDPPPAVDVATTILWGARDPIFPPWLAEGLSGSFTRLREVRQLDDVGHFVHLEAAEDTAEAVATFL